MTQRMEEATRAWSGMSAADRKELVRDAGLNQHLAEETKFDWLPEPVQRDFLASFDGQTFNTASIRQHIAGRTRLHEDPEPPLAS